MRPFRDVLIRRIKQLEELIAVKTEALEMAPKGCLRIGHSGDSVQFFDRHIYLPKDDGTIKILAQKNYDQKVLKAALREKEQLERALEGFPVPAVEEVYQKLNPIRQELIDPVIRPDDEFVRRWLSEPYIRKPFAKNAPVIYTNKGERVRSKSEKMLADMFFLHGQPYKLECPLSNMYGEVIHPDFTLLRVKSRTIFYWEHCGMLDDPRYASDLDERLRFYGSLGIFPGKGLLLTTETDGRPIDMRLAEEMMRQVLL